MRPRFVICLSLVLSYATTQISAADQSSMANLDPTYVQLRNIGLSGEAITVNNLTLKRDAGTFHLHSGTLCFLAPVQGKVTGAVFEGDGNFVLEPPIPLERGTLKLLTKESEYGEAFSSLVLRFTDATYEEVRKSGAPASAGCSASPLDDSKRAMRHDHMLRYNLEGRLLEDVLGTEPGGFFLAFVHGKHYNGKTIYAVDPHGAPQILVPVAPEEVELVTWDENKAGVWAAFHLSDEYKSGKAVGNQNNAVMQIEHQQLDTTIEKSANLIGKSATAFISQMNGLRVVPFDLFPSLRVQRITGLAGESLSFIQEDKREDADLYVILPKALAAGEKYTINTEYAGKEAVTNEGSGNYYPVARDNWYPNSSFGQYAAYDMTFRVPKGMQMAATGTLASESNDGDHAVSVWKSEVPLTVAGFSFGRFKKEEGKVEKFGYLVESYANENPPDWVQGLQHEADNDLPSQGSHVSLSTLGNMGTTGLNKKALAEGQLALQIYSDYFGPISYKQVALTQQTACNYGQAWPGVIYIPLCYFFDTTIRHQLGMDFGDRGYWRVVTPHEVAHQWWGHTVGFESYRDQWMSEGFAELSASIYLQAVYSKDPKKYFEFWNDERELLTERTKEGVRAIDAGPVILGYRMSNSRTGFDLTRRLIYPKGGYILHMIRMMMRDRRTGDQPFKELMQDFVKTYANRSATTEDFKSMVEKHMTQEMDLDGNHKMDWFFNEYVYGTALPKYDLQSSFETGSDGDVVWSFKVTQSGVDDHFKMLVPLYLQLADGRTMPLGRVSLRGNTSFDQKVPLKGLKDKPRGALVNYNYDVLAEK
jgi:hypothetical protein